jgi:hypothetical protein
VITALLLTSLAQAGDPPEGDWGLGQDLPAWGAWAGDPDQDGRVDLITVAHKQWSWLEQDEQGRFQPSEVRITDKVDRHGMTSCDVDRDGRAELLIAVGGNRGAGGEPAELWRLAEAPTNLGSSVLTGTEGARMRGATCSDFDGDGWPELWMPAMGTQWPDRLVVHGPDGWHEDAEGHGLAQLTTVMGGTWGDLDGDGDLDLVRIRERLAEVLIQQDGAFTPTLVLPAQDVSDLVLEDLDNDGDVDLFVATDADRFATAEDGHVRMRVNQRSFAEFSIPDGCGPLKVAIQGDVDGQPAEIVHASGSFRIVGRIGQDELSSDKPTGKGVLVWRVAPRRLRFESGDGAGFVQVGLRCKKSGELPKLEESSTPGKRVEASPGHLFLNEGGRLVEAQVDLPALNVADAVPVDVDLDGDLDLFLVTAMDPAHEGNPPDVLLLNEGGRFTVRELDLPPAPIEGYVGLATDLNGDGYPELISFNGEHFAPLAGQPQVWDNPGGGNGFVRVVAREGQATSLAASVQVRTRGGTQTRLSNPSPDWRSNGGTAQVFGVGRARSAAVTVTWPDGTHARVKARPGETVFVDKP